MTTVVIGPKTRLGREVLAQAVAGGSSDVVAVARDAADAAVVAGLPGLSAGQVVDAGSGSLTARLRSGTGPVRLVVAALGPVHPEDPQGSDAAAVERDLGFVGDVLACGRPVHVVLVSTIIALAPGEDRRYYGGWKALVEEQLQHLVDDCNAAGGNASLSVLYPGRLLDAAERKGKLRLHTSYTRLGNLALKATPATGRLVGADARIWLSVRSISFGLRSLKASKQRSRRTPPTRRGS